MCLKCDIAESLIMQGIHSINSALLILDVPSDAIDKWIDFVRAMYVALELPRDAMARLDVAIATYRNKPANDSH